MNGIYNLIFLFFAIFSIPKFLVRLNQAKDGKELFKQRLGIFPKNWSHQFSGKNILWLHAVSVGEVNAAKHWLQLFLREYPEWNVALSTTTPTGQMIAQSLSSERVSVFYSPIDVSFIVRRVMEFIQPKVIVLMETELWPNLIGEAKSKNIPIGIINGRISPRSFKRYKWIKGWLKNVLNQLSFCLVQSDLDESYFSKLGMDPKRMIKTGNLKFDLNGKKSHAARVFKEGSLSKGLIFLGGSTHWNEEEILLRVFNRLKNENFSLKLVLAPRHPEQLPRVIEAVKRYPFKFQFYSEKSVHDFHVLVIDQMGILASFYEIADVVFIGGSLISKGGQNPFEAACFKKTVLHGPHIFNFQEIYQKLHEHNAAIEVSGEEELYQHAKKLIEQPNLRWEMGVRAWETTQLMKGATERTMNYLSKFLEQQTSSQALV